MKINLSIPICLMTTGAFLIPYFCVYFLIGTPLYFLELSLGQFGSRGATAAFKMSRMFKGTADIFYINMIRYFNNRSWLGNGNQFIFCNNLL
jgi:SNF family Na+-dependent transporter